MIVILQFLLLAFFILPFFGAAYIVCGKLLPREAVSARLLAALILSLTLILLAVKSLLILHLFTRGGMGAAALLPFAFSVIAGRRSPWWTDLRTDGRRGMETLRELLAYPGGILLWPGALLGVFTAVRGLFTPPLSWDSLSFHMVLAGKFVQTGGNFVLGMPGSLNILEYHPRNFESLLALILLPFGTDTLVNLVNLPFLAMGILGFYVLARCLDLPIGRLRAGLMLFMFTPAFFAYIPTQYVDPSVACLLLAGMAFAALYLKGAEFPMAVASMSILCFSLAFGMKSYAFAALILGTLVLGITALRRKQLKPIHLLILTAALSMGLPHYLRMAAEFHNPFYPFPTEVLGRAVGQSHPSLVHYLRLADDAERAWHASKTGARTPGRWVPYAYSAAKIFSQSHISLGAASLLATLLGLFGFWRVKDRVLLALILLNIAASWMLFFAPSMEGLRLLFSESYSRYLVFPTALGILLGLLAFPGFRVCDVLLWILGLTQFILSVPEKWIMQDIYWAVLALLLLAWMGATLWKRKPAWLLVPLALLILGMPLIQHLRDKWRFNYLNTSHDVSLFSPKMLAAYPLLDKPDAPARIAFAFAEKKLSGDWCYLYPLMGRRLQNDVFYIPFTRSGRIVDYEFWETTDETADESAWLGRLKASRADYFAVSTPWPPERAWTKSHPDLFKTFYESEGVEVYRVAHAGY